VSRLVQPLAYTETEWDWVFSIPGLHSSLQTQTVKHTNLTTINILKQLPRSKLISNTKSTFVKIEDSIILICCMCTLLPGKYDVVYFLIAGKQWHYIFVVIRRDNLVFIRLHPSTSIDHLTQLHCCYFVY